MEHGKIHFFPFGTIHLLAPEGNWTLVLSALDLGPIPLWIEKMYEYLSERGFLHQSGKGFARKAAIDP